jgi:hypothetical protein
MNGVFVFLLVILCILIYYGSIIICADPCYEWVPFKLLTER